MEKEIPTSFKTTATIGARTNGQKYFHDFGIHPNFCSIYGAKPEDIIHVECSIHKNQKIDSGVPKLDYWGWFDLEEFKWSTGGLMQPSHAQFSMCFPYGYKAEEERGRGKAYRLMIKQIKTPSEK